MCFLPSNVPLWPKGPTVSRFSQGNEFKNTCVPFSGAHTFFPPKLILETRNVSHPAPVPGSPLGRTLGKSPPNFSKTPALVRLNQDGAKKKFLAPLVGSSKGFSPFFSRKGKALKPWKKPLSIPPWPKLLGPQKGGPSEPFLEKIGNATQRNQFNPWGPLNLSPGPQPLKPPKKGIPGKILARKPNWKFLGSRFPVSGSWVPVHAFPSPVPGSGSPFPVPGSPFPFPFLVPVVGSLVALFPAWLFLCSCFCFPVPWFTVPGSCSLVPVPGSWFPGSLVPCSLFLGSCSWFLFLFPCSCSLFLGGRENAPKFNLGTLPYKPNHGYPCYLLSRPLQTLFALLRHILYIVSRLLSENDSPCNT